MTAAAGAGEADPAGPRVDSLVEEAEAEVKVTEPEAEEEECERALLLKQGSAGIEETEERQEGNDEETAYYCVASYGLGVVLCTVLEEWEQLRPMAAND